MATWKKLLVSGSNISQLVNDAGYLTSVTAQTAFVTASFNGTHLIANDSQGQLNFASSSGAGLTISANAGSDTLTFGLSSIPNNSLANDGITIAGNDISLGGSITAATIYAGTGVVSSSAQIDHDATTNFDANEHFTQANITTVGTVTAGSVTAILPAGTVSGSITSPSQGTLAVNGVNVDLGLQTGDSPQFTNLTVTGDLTITGDTIQAQVTNLNIEDRYILLNSGSSTIGDSGIIFGGANGVAQSGVGLVWDGSYNTNDGRLSIVNTLAANATGDQTPSYHIAGVFEGTEANAATAQADHVGNIRVESGDIFIYV